MSVDLSELDILFDDLDIDVPTKEQMSELYRIYKTEICNITFKGERIKVNNNKSHHPICKGKHQTFEHIITRKSEYSGKRNFDNQRANRINWIKPIIENYKLPCIKYFEEKNKNNQLQYFFFYEDRDFIVIARELPNGRMLITAFCVDGYEKNRYKKRYNLYIKKTPLRK